MAKCRDIVYTGLLSMEVNAKSALRLHFISVISMCVYVPYASSIPETEMATFRKIHIACSWNQEYGALFLTWTVKFTY